MYKFYLCDIPSLEEVIDDINRLNGEIVSSFYCSDSQQIGIIYEIENKPTLKVFGKVEDEEE